MNAYNVGMKFTHTELQFHGLHPLMLALTSCNIVISFLQHFGSPAPGESNGVVGPDGMQDLPVSHSA